MGYLGNSNSVQNFTPAVDYFNGNGSTTSFTLSRTVGSAFDIQAFIENVPQNPSSAFTVAGNVITFTSAPPSGTNNIYVRYTSPVTQLVKPAPGTVSPTEINSAYSLWNLSGSNINYTAGNVGIGTASPVAGTGFTAGRNLLQIIPSSGTANAQVHLGGTSGTILDHDDSNYTITTLRNLYGASSSSALMQLQSGYITFGTGTSYTEAMRITSAGLVGIGTTNPSGKLDVYTDSNTDVYVRGGNAVRLFLTASSYDWKISSNYYNTGGISFVNGGTSVFNLPQSGGFGVYTNSPTGLGSHTGASNVSTINQSGLTLTQYGVIAGFYYDRLNFNNSQYFVVNSGGTGVYIGNGSTSWTAYSDSRLKNITGTYTNALSDITQLQPVKFTWKSDVTNKPCVGVIAQSVLPVVPEAVDTSKLPNNSEDETEYLAVRYTELIPLMIAAIQEQQAIIEDLKARIEILEDK